MATTDRLEQAPLTGAQLGIYIESVRDPEIPIYHMPYLLRLPGVKNAARLADAVREVTKEFPGMSAQIRLDGDGNPCWIDCRSTRPIEVETLEMTEQELSDNASSLIRPFVFENSPLGRIKVIKTESGVYLFFDFHHTVCDGASRKTMLKAIDAAYRGLPMNGERLTMFDIARREARQRASGMYEEARDAYAGMLDGCDPAFDLLPDVNHATPTSAPEFDALSVEIPISPETYGRLSREKGMPRSVAATAAMGALLQVCYRRDDVTFSTIYHGRRHEDEADTFGMMVKTLPVRCTFDDSTTVGSLLETVKKNLKTARDNDLYSFADAARDFGVNSDLLFAFQGDFLESCTINGVMPEQIPLRKLSTGSKVTANLLYSGDTLTLAIEYRSDLFSAGLMRTFAETYGLILSQILESDSDTPVRNLALVSGESLVEVLRLSDGGKSLAEQGATVIGLFRESALRYPERVAVTFRDRRLSYSELDRITDSMAAVLTERHGAGAGKTIGIMIERSELMAVFPIAVMKTGAAYMPLDPHFPEDRLMFMISDAGVDIILSDDSLAETVIPNFGGIVLTASELRNPDVIAGVSLPSVAPQAPMVVLYTSGSTGKPKGVTLTQGNIANFVAAYRSITGMDSGDRVGAYAAFGFDAHMLDMYPTLSSGAALFIFDSEIRLDLSAMHDYMEQERITIMFMTTQIAWQMATLFDFTTLRVMAGGGEKLPPLDHLPYTFINLYGPTECSVAATACLLDGPADGRNIGSPLPGYEVRVLDSRQRLLPKGMPGELVILGRGVGLGYLNRAELTAEKFITIDGIPAYRTGDHGRYMPDGDIEFLGRIDGMVKLRGLRIELGEIEAVATRIPGIKAFAAAVKKIGNMENLVGYYTPADGFAPDPAELRNRMRESLSEFMVPEIMVEIDSMPLTPNGKIDRRRLPVPEHQAETIVMPEGEDEKRLYDIVAEVLGHTDFGVCTNLLSAGLSSLMAMRLVASIMKRTGMKVTAKTVMSAPTVRDIVKALAEASPDAGVQVQGTPDRRYYPLTENQRGVYIDWEMNRDALQYNIPQAFRFGHGTDAEALCRAVTEVVHAHPGLLTRMVMRNGDVMQVRQDAEDFAIQVTDLDRMPDTAFFQSMVRPFDLFGESLFRCAVFRYGDEAYMFTDMHHIIFDGVSAMIFMDELARAYSGKSPEGEELTALDNALRENALMESDAALKAEQWFDTLIGDSESTSYPHSTTPDNDIAGGMGRIRLRIGASEVKKFCSSHGLTASNYLLSAFLQLLHRLTREETVQITTVDNGRNDLRLLSTTGMFVKTLPVVSRCKEPARYTPAAFAEEIQRQFLTTQDYGFYPFTALVEKKGVRPEIMYVYEGGIDLSGMSGEGRLISEKLPLSLDTAKVPLTLLVFEPDAETFELVTEYDTSCYSVDDMTVLLRMMASLSLSLPQSATVADGIMTDKAQRDQLDTMRDGRKCEVPYTSVHGTVEQRVDEHPDRMALVACDRRLTYREFDNECNRIANALIRRGVCHGDRIVILLPRKASLITAIYGTMKTGSAYIPCDPEYPAERIRLITEDSGARYIITTSDRKHLYDNAIDIDELLAESDDTRPAVVTEPEDVAYMIYTSGSTGRPKGVMIPQRAICNYVYGYYDMNYRNNPAVKTEMLLVTISFDASLNNLAVSLTCGHTLVLADEDECKDVVLLSRLMLDNGVDSFDITPSRLEAMLELPEFCDAVARCSHVNIGGEGFQPALITKLFGTGFHGKAINEYGPTETTVGSNRAELTPGSPITAGVPFVNVRQYIVDAWGGELPVGAVGELYISGRGVGLGYNNLPEKTAAAYVNYSGARAYRTGDLAKWTPDGNVAILGRIDHQVKIRGLRIELGEIESVALEFEGMGRVAANVVEINKVQHLCLYYTSDVQIDNEALREFLASRLTEYMVPDAFMQISRMPLTPNGKTNRKALPIPQIEGAAEYVEPEEGLERTIADAFTAVLSNERTGANDDFFAIGGTSINAIKLVAALSLAGYSVTYKNVFAARTPRGLAALIEGRGRDASAVVPVDISIQGHGSDKSEFADILGRNTIETFRSGESRPLGDVMLTGATGFMGIHMLHELLVNHDGRIVCLLRRKGDISPESRLRTLLFYYFDNAFEEEFNSGRISVIECDVTSPLSEETASLINVDTVVNCAANVKHFSAGNDIELVNVESVRNLIAFCVEKGVRLVHVSTVSIAGESVNGYPDPALLLTERMMDFGQSLSNQYVHSKYEAEKLILTAVRDRGLDAKIMRVGNLSARGSDGEFQINFRSNAFMGKIKAYATLGCAPYGVLDAPCEFSPIDEVCRAILLLSSTPHDMTVFQPCNNHRLPLGDILAILNECGHEVRAVESDDFETRKREAMDDPEMVNALQPLLAYDSDKDSRTSFIRYDAGYTNQILFRLGFRWNYTSHDYVEQFLKAIDALNFFDL